MTYTAKDWLGIKLKLGDYVCRKDDPRHAGRLNYIHWATWGRVTWLDPKINEQVDLDDLRKLTADELDWHGIILLVSPPSSGSLLSAQRDPKAPREQAYEEHCYTVVPSAKFLLRQEMRARK